MDMKNTSRLFLFAVLLCLFSVAIKAKQLTADEALARLNGKDVGFPRMRSRAKEVMHLQYTASKDGVNLFYIFNNKEDNRAVIIGADDLIPAVLAYDLTQFETDNIPDNIRCWLRYYEDAISLSIRQNVPMAESLPKGNVIEPLLQTKWDQDAPYNELCAEKVGEVVPTGCVATAMAQVMYYWRYPLKGKSTNTYRLSPTCELSANFRETYYDWDNMQQAYAYYYPEGSNRLVYADYTQEQAAAVAELMYHCGVAVEMIYEKKYSGASHLNLFTALDKYFGYDKAQEILHRDWFSDEIWQQMLLTELYERRPVIYCGVTTDDEGHCFICDGFDGDGYFHFNWGWAGKADGYYMVAGTDPLHPTSQGTGGSPTSKPFTESQIIIVGIQPAISSSFPKINVVAYRTNECSQGPVSGVLSDDLDSEIVAPAQRGKVYNMTGIFYNFSNFTIKVELGAIMRNIETNNEYICGSGEIIELKPFYGMNQYRLKLDPIAENGVYEIYPAYKIINEGQSVIPWRKMQQNTDANPFVVTVDGDTPILEIVDAYLINCDGYVTESPELSVTVKALKDFSDIKLSATVNNANQETINGFSISTGLSMKAGEVRCFNNISLRNNKRDKKLEQGKEYTVKIGSTNYPFMLGNKEYTTLQCCVDVGMADAVDTPNSQPSTPNSQLIYDLSGRKMFNAEGGASGQRERSGNVQSSMFNGLKKGIYIKNGKKVVVN